MSAPSDRRLRIVHVIDQVTAGGGAETLELVFAEAVRDRHAELTIVALQRFAGEADLVADLRATGAKVLVLPVRKGVGPWRALRRTVELARIIRQSRADVVRTSLAYANVLGVAAARLTATPVLATLHGTPQDAARQPWMARWAETAALRWGAQRVLVVSESVARAQRSRLGRREPLVVPNAVAPPEALSAQERSALRAELLGGHDGPLLVSVGRLVPGKGVADLVAAFGLLAESCPGAVLLVVGSGPLHDELSHLAQRGPAGGRVMFLGHRRDVTDLLAASDLYVSTSLEEGLPVATLEAMAAGLPVVATAVGEVPALLGSDRGVLLTAGEPEQAAAALGALLADPEAMARYGQAGAAHVATHHSAAGWTQQLLATYRDVAARRPKAVD